MFPNKSNSNARKVENRYFFSMKVRSKISNNHAPNKTNLWIKQKREKTKTSLWNRQGNEEPIFPTKHWKINMRKETRITPSKERLKTTWITHAFQVQNKPKPTHENEMYISNYNE